MLFVTLPLLPGYLATSLYNHDYITTPPSSFPSLSLVVMRG